jgi:hypothetical protein
MKTEQRINPQFLVKLKDIERNEEAIDAVEDTNSTENKKARFNKSQVNAMTIVFFNIRGVILISRYLRIKRLIKTTTWRS